MFLLQDRWQLGTVDVVDAASRANPGNSCDAHRVHRPSRSYLHRPVEYNTSTSTRFEQRSIHVPTSSLKGKSTLGKYPQNLLE